MFSLEVRQTLEGISAAEWNALTCPDYPFADYEHLHALEVTGCAGPDMGWLPFYVIVRDSQARLCAATFCYVKSHGYGEFVFDHAWNQAYARAGQEYYPKLVAAVPYTPATGPRVLVHPAANRSAMETLVADELISIAKRIGCSSVHVLFLQKEHLSSFAQKEFMLRHGFQYHWFNNGYANFDQFLSTLKSKRRRQIQLERRQLLATSGLTIETRTGNQLTEEDADLMARLYLDTNERWGSIPCLSREFFRTLIKTMADRVVLFVAHLDCSPIAAAINFKKGEKMFGRYWGCLREVRFLHFELCYYQAIEYCIVNKLKVYEAGAQGEHKIPRGFIPQLTYSMHFLADDEFIAPVRRFLEQEKGLIDDQFREWEPHLPYT
ncbi:MAG: GNAT family N-acetyltransferase [Betaproteobacteria bacterium]|nr:GNAT family N-acetyltransferase [Betaproteobacteria bacterium]